VDRGVVRGALGAGALAALTLLAPLSPPGAQTVPPTEVGITGKVVALPGPTICDAGTHMLECTDVLLEAADGVLDPLVGKTVKLFGTKDDYFYCNIVDVSSVQDPPPSTLAWCGSPVSGCKLKFTVCPGGLSQYWLFASLSSGFKPFLPAKGTWLLGDPAFLIAVGASTANECHEVSFIVPPLPAVSGVDVWLQAAHREIGEVGPVTLTNAVCLTLQPVGPPCTTTSDC
jgi:hypothetical protein